MQDNRTPNLNLPLPHPENTLQTDVVRLISALSALDAAVANRATHAELSAAITGLVDSAPGALDTLNELAAALGDDANFAATVTNLLSQKVSISDIVNNLTSTATDKPLSAAQGKVLNDAIGLVTRYAGKNYIANNADWGDLTQPDLLGDDEHNLCGITLDLAIDGHGETIDFGNLT